MKNTLIITSIIAIIGVSLAIGYYFLITLPTTNQRQFELDKQKQEQDVALKKETLKNECLKIKYSPQEESLIPSFHDYQQTNLSCDQ